VKASATALIALLGFTAAVFAQEEAALRPDAIGKDQVGKKIAVEGRIYSNSKSRRESTSTSDPTQPPRSGAGAGEVDAQVQVDIVKKYDKRNVRLTGKVEEQSGKYFIRIDEPSQLKVVAKKTSH
jgi:hypothetical protein